MPSLRYVCAPTILFSAMALAQSQPTFAIHQIARVPAPVSSSGLPSKNSRGPVRRTTSAQLSFAPMVTYNSGGSQAWGVAVGDVNGDGKPDLVVGNFCPTTGKCGNGVVGVLLGNGDGTYQPALSYGSGGYQANAVVIADVNGDGKPDILVANWCANSSCVNGSVGVLLGNGNGTFQRAVAYGDGGVTTVALAVADLNGDGKPDIVVANWCGNNACVNGVWVLLGNGDGTFQTAVSYDSGGILTASVAVADVNGDGIPDVITEGCNGQDGCPTVAGVLLGNGDGTFQPAVTYAESGVGDMSVTVGDLNGDGIPDLVAANCGASQGCGLGAPEGVVGVLLGNGDGTFQGAMTYYAGGLGTNTAVLADVNGDGYLDIIALNNAGSGVLAVLLGNGNGSFQGPMTFSAGPGGAVENNAQSLVVADVNGDGKPDVILVEEGETVDVLINTSIYPTSCTLTSSPNPSNSGQSVTFSATVSQPLVKGLTPTGNVTFFDGVNNLGSATLNSSATAALAISTLATGTHSITATYSGDSNFASSTSPVLSQSVGKGEPVVRLSPSRINFGDQRVGTTSAPQTVTLTNTGNGTLTITKISVTGPFTQTNTCGSSVAAAASCTFTVKFEPTTTGIRTGSVSIIDNGSRSPQEITLGGTGTHMQLNHASFNFGNQAVGTKSTATQTSLTD